MSDETGGNAILDSPHYRHHYFYIALLMHSELPFHDCSNILTGIEMLVRRLHKINFR